MTLGGEGLGCELGIRLEVRVWGEGWGDVGGEGWGCELGLRFGGEGWR